MNVQETLTKYKKITQVQSREKKIQETIIKSKAAYLAAEQEQMLSYQEFLWTQLKSIRKRWWLLQALLLLALWVVLLTAREELYIQRSMGVIASLFVILIIPELWKSRSHQFLEIEAAAYYSLRQIYAARMLLFGIADIFFITIFCGTATMGLRFELTELMVQFLFPLSVTACICFGILSSKRAFSEMMAIALCIIWSTVWMFIILDARIYARITLPIWLLLLGLAVLFITITIYRTISSNHRYWEVSFDKIRTP